MNPFLKAQPIWTDELEKVNQYAAFRQPFNTEINSEDLVMRIRAAGRYAIRVNGVYLPYQQYSDYEFYRVFDEIPIPKELLKTGENLLAILAYCPNQDSFCGRKECPSLIFELCNDNETIAASGALTLVSYNTGYVSGEIEKITSQLSYSFRFNSESVGEWYMPEYRPESDWKAACLLPYCGDYHPRPIKQLTVGLLSPAHITAQGVFKGTAEALCSQRIHHAWMRHIPYKEIASGAPDFSDAEGVNFSSEQMNDIEIADGIYVIVDMERERSGYISFDFEVDSPCDIDCGFGEHMDDLRVRTAVGGRNFAFSYRAKAGRNRFFHPFKRIGGRYLQFHVSARKFRLFSAGILPVEYPVSEKPEPHGLNLLQQHIYKTAVHTLRCCMHEHYEDTPWREQALYAMDSRNMMLFTYDAFGDKEYVKANLRLSGLGIREDGLLELCAPARIKETIPCFSLIWIIAMNEYLSRSKDTDFMCEMLPSVQSVLSFFAGWQRDGLIYNPQEYWGFYEWSPYMDGINESRDKQIARDGFDAPLNAFYALAIDAAGKIFKAVGLLEYSDSLALQKSELKQKYHEVFWSPEKKAYRVSSTPECENIFPQLVQALTVCAALCTDESEEKSIISRLLTDEFSPKATLSHAIFLYEAVLHDQSQRNAVLDETDKRWGEMVFKGATSFWETEQGSSAFNNAGSLCHGWSAVPIWVYHKIIG